MIEYELFSCKKSKKIDRIVSVDMHREAFYPLNLFLNTQIEAAWVEELKTDLVSNRRSSQETEYWPSWTNTRCSTETTTSS